MQTTTRPSGVPSSEEMWPEHADALRDFDRELERVVDNARKSGLSPGLIALELRSKSSVLWDESDKANGLTRQEPEEPVRADDGWPF